VNTATEAAPPAYTPANSGAGDDGVYEQDSAVRIAIDGELTIFSVQAIKQRVDDVWPAAEHGVDLDVSEVDEVDGAGIQLLMYFRLQAAAKQRSLRLLSPSEAVREALSLVHLTSFFHYHASTQRSPDRSGT